MSEMAFFADIAKHIWICLKILKPCKGNQIKYIFFSGHLDIEQPFPVKKFEIWQKLSQWRGGFMLWFSQSGVMDNWPSSSKEPPHPWLKLCQISWQIWVVLS